MIRMMKMWWFYSHIWIRTRGADQWGHVSHVSGWGHSVSPPGAACHPLSRSSSKNFLPPGPAKWFLHPWRLWAPLPTPHELWQYPGNIYLTKANNSRSTLQSREQRVSGTREFNNWFNASLHIKAKDFAKRCGQKQSVHYIICRAPDSRRAQREISDKKSQIIISKQWRGREGSERKWKLGNLAFLVVGFKCLQVCLILVSRDQSFSNNKHSALIRIIHKIHKIIHMLLTFPVWGGGAIAVSW